MSRKDHPKGRLVYLVVGTSDSQVNPARLYSVPSDGSLASIELTDPTPADSEGVRDFVIGSRTGFVYYASDQVETGVVEVFRVPIDGSGAPKLLVDL